MFTGETNQGSAPAAETPSEHIDREVLDVRCAKCFEFVISTLFPCDWDEELEGTECHDCRTATAGRAFLFTTSHGRTLRIVYDPSQYPTQDELPD